VQLKHVARVLEGFAPLFDDDPGSEMCGHRGSLDTFEGDCECTCCAHGDAFKHKGTDTLMALNKPLSFKRLHESNTPLILQKKQPSLVRL
jgi:hypothetical protein